MKKIALIALALFVCSCTISKQEFDSTMSSKAVKRAAFDMDCDQQDISVTVIDSKTFGVKGCGKRLTYIVVDPRCTPGNYKPFVEEQCTVVLNTDSSEEAPEPAEPAPSQE